MPRLANPARTALQPANAAARSKADTVESADSVTAFVYALLRDHVPLRLCQEALAVATDKNHPDVPDVHLDGYAFACARRLRREAPPDHSGLKTLAKFLRFLLTLAIPFGDMEKLVQESENGVFIFSNRWLAEIAITAAAELA